MLLKVFLIFVCFQLITALTEVKPCKPDVTQRHDCLRFVYRSRLKKSAGQVIAPSEVQFGDCVTAPCLGPRGNNLTVEVNFVAEDNFDSVVTNMYAMVAGMKHGYPGLDNTDACKNIYSMPDKSPVGCPIEKGKSYQYGLVIPIKPTFPKITANIHIGVKDKSSTRVAACFETVLKIV